MLSIERIMIISISLVRKRGRSSFDSELLDGKSEKGGPANSDPKGSRVVGEDS
jgi:hypothetical protein